jgi:hypothetical protein
MAVCSEWISGEKENNFAALKAPKISATFKLLQLFLIHAEHKWYLQCQKFIVKRSGNPYGSTLTKNYLLKCYKETLHQNIVFFEEENVWVFIDEQLI